MRRPIFSMITWDRFKVGVFVLYLLVFIGGTIYENYTCGWNRGLWQDAVCKSPEKPRPRLNMGRAYVLSGDYVHAKDAFRDTVDLSIRRLRESSDYESLEILASAQTNLAILAMVDGDLSGAERTLKATLTLTPPHSLNALLQLTNLYVQQERWAEVITLVDEAIVAETWGPAFGDPQRAKLYTNKAIALCANGFIDQANQHFDFAKHLWPEVNSQCE